MRIAGAHPRAANAGRTRRALRTESGVGPVYPRAPGRATSATTVASTSTSIAMNAAV